MNRAVDLNSPFIEIVNLVYFIQEKTISNLNKKNAPTTNSDKFLKKTSEIGFVKKSLTRYYRQVNKIK